MNDGTLSYPPIEEKEDINLNANEGMSFELRYINPSHHHSLFIVHISFD
jgi:hypothetical protein